MKIIYTFILFLFIHSIFAQQTQEIEPEYQLRALSTSDELQLKRMPVLNMTAASRSRDLPYMVDNSTEMYMRPVFNQAGLSCGQASGVAYNFTYEMARARNVPANTGTNQYTTHFTWNWMHGGNGWYGVSYLHSFQILKYVGDPSAAIYGGLSYGGPKRWMSGYSNYYTAMTNRITEAYQIPCGTAEGLITLKHWLNDHLDGSDVGGVASYYAQYLSVSNQLDPGTPEAGKYVITNYGGSPNHAMTIVGYNDSIRWDYNNDGQYTNNIDINNDGEVNMKDWEIGGFKMVQSYGGVPNWGNQGYAYMMYKTIADDLGQGGVWNHCVHVLDVKENYEPKLTAQVTLTHNKRNQIKVLAGLSNNANSSYPDFTIDLPIFDYQGASYYMQGGESQEDKTIEFGLDLSALLTEVSLNQNVKIFLMVVENDPAGNGNGSMDSFSIWDYTNSPVNTACSQNNVPLQNNDTTILSIVYNFNFDRINIEDETLPPAPEGTPYSHQMTASGGTAPYFWEFDKTYETSAINQTYPAVSGQQLYPSNNSNGKVTRLLDFDFPYYDSSFSSICVHVDGYLMFDEQLYPYPYFNDDKVLFEVTRNISPFNTQFQRILTANGDGIWYEGDSTYATFWWKTTIEDDNSTSFNYAVTLFPNGEIRFFYNTMNGLQNLDWWIAGISDGDTKNLEVLEISHDQSMNPNQRFDFSPYDYPNEFEISADGLFSGTPLQAYSGTEISFKVIDNNFISATKTLLLSSSGIIVQNSVQSGDDELIEFGETALISIVVTNLEEENIENTSMEISIQDEYLTLIDSTEYLGTLFPGIPLSKPDAFSFSVSSGIPNNYSFTFNTTLITPDTSYLGTITYTAFAPMAIIANVLVDDENSRLDPGDTTDIVLSIQNTGGATLNNVLVILNSTDPNITINSDEGTIQSLEPGESKDIIYNITVDSDANNGHLAAFNIEIFGDNNYTSTGAFDLIIGFNAEDFETGDLHFINWGFDGNKDWQIDLNTRYEGAFSARSGYISHMQESVMMLDMEILADGEISFYKKVSCEEDENNDNYDFLLFRIDGIEQQRWDGDQDWTLETFAVESGFHRFEWLYHKDTTVSRLLDGAWVDYITFPPGNDAPPICSYTPESFDKIMKPDDVYSDTLWITNTGEGSLEMELYVKGETLKNSGDRSIFGAYLTGSMDFIRSGHEYPMTLTLYNASADNEWIRDLYIDFPTGVELTNAESFVGGSGGDMLHDGTFGDGITAHWHGEDSVGWGVVKGGQTAVADIMVYIHDEFVENASLNFEIHGENYGGEPHIIYGSLALRNLGPEITWFSIDTNYTEIQGGETLPVVVNYNADGLEEGNYYAEILTLNNFQQEITIPVNLTVDPLVGMTEGINESNFMLTVYPNPLINRAFISYNLSTEKKVSLEIYNLQGKRIRSLIQDQTQKQGKFVISWDATTDSGAQLPTGIYFCKLTAGAKTEMIKLVITE